MEIKNEDEASDVEFRFWSADHLNFIEIPNISNELKYALLLNKEEIANYRQSSNKIKKSLSIQDIGESLRREMKICGYACILVKEYPDDASISSLFSSHKGSRLFLMEYTESLNFVKLVEYDKDSVRFYLDWKSYHSGLPSSYRNFNDDGQIPFCFNETHLFYKRAENRYYSLEKEIVEFVRNFGKFWKFLPAFIILYWIKYSKDKRLSAVRQNINILILLRKKLDVRFRWSVISEDFLSLIIHPCQFFSVMNNEKNKYVEKYTKFFEFEKNKQEYVNFVINFIEESLPRD